jgi:hypothetical protein
MPPGRARGQPQTPIPVAEISIGLRGRPRTSRLREALSKKSTAKSHTQLLFYADSLTGVFRLCSNWNSPSDGARYTSKTMMCNSKVIVCIRRNAVCLNYRIRPNAEPCWMEAQSCSSGNRGGGPHSKAAIGNARLLRMALYRRRLWGRLRRRPPRPVVGEAAMTSHAVWPAIGWQRTSFRPGQDGRLTFERWAFFERAGTLTKFYVLAQGDGEPRRQSARLRTAWPSRTAPLLLSRMCSSASASSSRFCWPCS